jgi:hypothetical protein
VTRDEWDKKRDRIRLELINEHGLHAQRAFGRSYRIASAWFGPRPGPPPGELGFGARIMLKLGLRWLRGKVAGWRGGEGPMKTVMKFLDGWKMVIGVVALFSVKVWDSYSGGSVGGIVESVLGALGWLPGNVEFAPAVASAVVLIGFFGKLRKARQQRRAGAKVSELLSAEGYARALEAERIRR